VSAERRTVRRWLLVLGLFAAALWGIAVGLAHVRSLEAERLLRASIDTSLRVTPRPRRTFPYGGGQLTLYSNSARTHTLGRIDYTLRPPVGGEHRPRWQQCGVYRAPVPEGRAVHSLEHGAVWITYQPGALPRATLEQLEGLTLAHRVILSPYPEQSVPLVATAWNLQLRLNAPNFGATALATLARFIDEYALKAPESNAPCDGGETGLTEPYVAGGS
jgi:Protein of unknown function (DUF3105)